MKNPIRKLTSPESAFTYSNDNWPLVAVIVIHLDGDLEEKLLTHTLAQLQNRHQLLRAKISQLKKHYFFEELEQPKAIPLNIIPRANENSCETATQKALNSHFSKDGPLMKVIYLRDTEASGEILLVIHHSIIDGIGARLILTDFLRLLGGQHLREIKGVENTHSYPSAYQGISGLAKKTAFMTEQMLAEISFGLKGEKLSIPKSPKNGIMSFRLSEDVSQRVLQKTGKMGLSMNSLIMAAMLHALFELDKKSAPKWLRAIIFADMRSKMVPPVPAHALGCYLSMARFVVKMNAGQPLAETATELWKATYQAGKKGDMLMYSMLSHEVVKMTIRMNKFRMAHTALSYIGKLELQHQYSNITVKDVKAFITNNHLGPVLTAFGLCLFGQIGICMNYLTAELTAEQAKQLMLKTKQLLEEFV